MGDQTCEDNADFDYKTEANSFPQTNTGGSGQTKRTIRLWKSVDLYHFYTKSNNN